MTRKLLSCPRCGLGIDDDGDGNCAICAHATMVTVAHHTVRWIAPQYSRDEGYFYCEGCKGKLTNGVAYVDGMEYRHVLEGSRI